MEKRLARIRKRIIESIKKKVDASRIGGVGLQRVIMKFCWWRMGGHQAAKNGVKETDDGKRRCKATRRGQLKNGQGEQRNEACLC